MRLLNTSNYILQDFTGNQIPKYAILSHRWEGHELTFQDIQTFNLEIDRNPLFSDGHGRMTTAWLKIEGACAQACWKDRYEWIWIDSCCIDKTSSAELSEAINSMFVWYKNAEVCYAYLSDVDLATTRYASEPSSRLEEQFKECRWFTRGWTLQELLAPRQLRFFSGSWHDLGSRKELWSVVSNITGIEDWNNFKSATIAQKMSWASRRETTRTEDRAYSLMGLFGVNMPPLYGEGKNAFIRLQLEILKISDDKSIFAWENTKDSSGGLLAQSPDAFRNSGDVKRYDSVHYEKPPYSMTNKGLQVDFPILEASQVHVELLDADDTFLAFLQCRPARSYSMLAILLRRIRGNQFTKVSSAGLIVIEWSDSIQSRVESAYRTVQVKQEDDSDISFSGLPQYRFSVATDLLASKGFYVKSRLKTWSTSSGNSWESQIVEGEDSISIDQATGNDGITTAVQFIGHKSSKHENDWESAIAFREKDSFVMVFNMYAGRAQLGVMIPRAEVTMDFLLEQILLQPKGWVTSNLPLQSSQRLLSGARITAQLIRKPTELWSRNYKAVFSLEDPVELPAKSSGLFLPVELENNEVKVIKRLDTASGEPEVNYYVRGYLLRKELNSHYPLYL